MKPLKNAVGKGRIEVSLSHRDTLFNRICDSVRREPVNCVIICSFYLNETHVISEKRRGNADPPSYPCSQSSLTIPDVAIIGSDRLITPLRLRSDPQASPTSEWYLLPTQRKRPSEPFSPIKQCSDTPWGPVMPSEALPHPVERTSVLCYTSQLITNFLRNASIRRMHTLRNRRRYPCTSHRL